MSKKKSKALKGGTFNLLNSRADQTVKEEVERLLSKYDLDFLCVQEAVEYRKVLDSIKGYKFYIQADVGFLVKKHLKVDRVKKFTYGDGWITVRGGKHPAAGQVQLRIDGWLYARGVHLPTPSDWSYGKFVAPAARADDYVESAKGLLRYFRLPGLINGRIALGDWNENPETMGQYSPAWIAKARKAKTWAPESREGHGRIDYVMGKGVDVPHLFKAVDFNEKSDHEAVIFVVKKT